MDHQGAWVATIYLSNRKKEGIDWKKIYKSPDGGGNWRSLQEVHPQHQHESRGVEWKFFEYPKGKLPTGFQLLKRFSPLLLTETSAPHDMMCREEKVSKCFKFKKRIKEKMLCSTRKPLTATSSSPSLLFPSKKRSEHFLKSRRMTRMFWGERQRDVEWRNFFHASSVHLMLLKCWEEIF